MDLRSWPWRKKLSERNAATVLAEPETSDPMNHASKLLDGLDFSNFLLSTVQKSDDSMARWQQAEEKLRILTDKLSVAVSENANKDNLVKQHSKVAEEAICGWEKAEAEATKLKLKLESVLHQKSAVEDRLSHVDGALKECMRQLRQVREEQEQTIHAAIVKNKRELDIVQEEFEAKLVEMDNQMLESKAENEVLSRSLQERARTVSELHSFMNQAETELSILHIRVDTAEKENSSLKYEIQVLTKELDIRNEERRYSKRETEISNKQHLEDTKRIAKVEAECQKLRVLVRRKLPGPAALAQMKVEVESPGFEMRSPFRRRTSFKHPGSYEASHLEAMQQRLRDGDRDMEILTERIYAMEEDSKVLREALAQRNCELHAARLLCARTASQLSTAESRLEAVSQTSRLGADIQVSESIDLSCKTSIFSHDSIGVDEASSDAWASALITELAHLKKEKPAMNSPNLLDGVKLNMMDDFSEMEHLASKIHLNEETEKEKRVIGDHNVAEIREWVSLDELAQKDKEIQDANSMCMELRNKLAATGQQLSELQHKNNANEAALIDIQERLDSIFETPSEGDDMSKLLEKVKVVMASLNISSQLKISTNYPEENNIASKAVRLPITLKNLKQDDANKDSKATIGTNVKAISGELNLEFIENLHKFIELLQTLGQTFGVTCSGGVLQPVYDEDQRSISNSQINNSSSRFESLPLDHSIQKMVTLSNKLLDGQSKFEELIQELCFFLNVFTKLPLIQSKVYQRATSKDPIVESSRIDQGEASTTIVAGSKGCILADWYQIDEASGIILKDIPPERSLQESLEAELNRFVKLEQELIHLKCEKAEIEDSLEAALQKIESISTQRNNADQLVTELQHKLESCEQSKLLLEEHLSEMATSKAMLESHVKSGNALVTSLEEKVHCLERKLEEECFNRQTACTKFQALQHRVDSVEACAHKTLIQAINSDCHHQVAEIVAKSRKENEPATAEKLTECERTILLLGQQLKALTSPQQFADSSFLLKTEAASSASHGLDPHSSNSEELQREGDVSGPSLNSGASKSSTGDMWVMAAAAAAADLGLDQHSPSTGYGAASPFHSQTIPVRKLDCENPRKSEFLSPDAYPNECIEREDVGPASPEHASNSCSGGGMSPARFLALIKRSSSNDCRSSAITRFFARTKTQNT